MKQPVNCKYTPLENHLRMLSATQESLTLTFDQIEQAMQSKLPKSAYLRLAWWDNEIHSTLSHKYAWLHAGWQVAKVDLGIHSVIFIRIAGNKRHN
jgi:hypothetical protein